MNFRDSITIRPVFMNQSEDGKQYQTHAQAIAFDLKEVVSVTAFLTPSQGKDGTHSQKEFIAFVVVQLKGMQPQSYPISFLIYDGKRFYIPRTSPQAMDTYYDGITHHDIPKISSYFSEAILNELVYNPKEPETQGIGWSSDDVKGFLMSELATYDREKIKYQQEQENATH